METRQVSEIVWREDLYPRFEPSPAVIQQYADVIDMLPPIEVNQHNELIDGYHRWTAHKKAGRAVIRVVITPTANEAEFLRMAIERNSKHGMQLSGDDKKRMARKLYAAKEYDKAQLETLLSVGRSTLAGWLSDIDKAEREERNRLIVDMWMACYTEEEIGTATGITHQTAHNQLVELQKNPVLEKFAIFSEYHEPDYHPPLYDVWTAAKASNKTKHFGMSEASFVDNLLYMYTQPFDIVVDPFAGGGSTIDVCKQRLRRCWASDRKPIVERRDIREWDIEQGPPAIFDKRRGNVSLLYLDPPYWKQAAGQYSDDAQDLANMSLEDFYQTLTEFIIACAGKMETGAHIALIIQPTQWRAPDKHYPVDHVFDLVARLPELRYVRRISAPYNTEQYNAQQVEWAKANRDVLILNREIIVWEVR